MAIRQVITQIKNEMKKVIVGQETVIENIIISYLANGHVIVEGVPGIAKTIIARTFAKTIGIVFNRIQFTPDLMPSDILGTMIFNLKKSDFVFKKGPIFTNILLADEINRASAKTQAALLEAMQEKQITIDGIKHLLPPPFMVLATQNPIEFEGTYPLPEAQLDRFLMKITVDYPEREVEIEVLKKFRDGFDSNELDSIRFEIIDGQLISDAQAEILNIKIDENILNYIMDIISQSRNHKSILLGASTRAAINLVNVSKFYAGLEERNYVIPDDIKQAVLPVLRHRIILQADAEIEGFNNDDIILQIVEMVQVPR